jgi:hypothetical protein
MLEPLTDLPAGVVGLRAIGTVLAEDVAAAITAAAAAPGHAPTKGMVVLIDPDFDGYLAELVRGLATAAVAPAPAFARFALIAPDGVVSEARSHGGDFAMRIFPASRHAEALAFAAGQ